MKSYLYRLIRFFKRRYVNRWVILFGDLFISLFSTFAVGFILLRLAPAEFGFISLPLVLVGSGAGSLAASFFFGTYKNIIRHSSAKDFWRVSIAVILRSLFVVAFLFACDGVSGRVNHALFFALFDFIFALVLMAGVRVVLIVFYDTLISFTSVNKRHRVLIYGFDEKSAALEMRLKNSNRFKVFGFCTFGKYSRSMRKLYGFPVYYFSDERHFRMFVAKYKINGVIFARIEDAREEENRIIRYCKDLRLKTLIAPSINEDINGAVNGTGKGVDVRKIKIEDLLGRDEINIDMQEVTDEFKDKVILVTGAAGSIGSELCRQLARVGIRKLIMFDSAETPLHNVRLEFENEYKQLDFVPVIGDVRVAERVRMVFEKYRPQIVFHAAAYKHVPLMEENPCEAVMVNVAGTRIVADMALAFGVEKFVMISTDKAVNPSNVMGCSKRLAEIYCQSLGTAVIEGRVQGHTKFITTRFGNVLGSNGSVIPLFRKQIENGGPVTVTHKDIIRFFMTIPEACRLVLEAATMGHGNEIFVFDMGEPVRIADLARRMIELAGYKPDKDIEIRYTGLRPGEKLYEEVLSNSENTIHTDHKKIMIAKARRYERESILPDFDELAGLAYSCQVIPTVKLMKHLVPEYKSLNSAYAQLDVQDK